MNSFSHMLAPVQVGNTILRNRLIHPDASPHFLQGPEPYPADSYIAHYASIARAGAGLVTVAEWNNYPAQRTDDGMADHAHMQAFDLTDASVQNYLSAMAEEIHFYGSKLIVHLEPEQGFPEGYSLHGGLPGGLMGNNVAPRQPATREMIQEQIVRLVQKAKLYRDLGYDGISFRISRYMLKSPSLRTDEYNGGVENRTRFIVEAMRAIRRELGSSFIIEATLHGEQPLGYAAGHSVEEGYSLSETLELIPYLNGLVDILTLRETDAARAHPISYNFRKGEHDTVSFARTIRQAGADRMLLALCGGFQDPVEIERLIASGVCDMVSMARCFFAEPEYEQKLREGRPEDITPCIWCNRCHGDLRPPWISVCSVNPRLGFEHKLGRMVQPPRRKKRVAVIGGGPAGMRAAIVAAQRGHTVTLYERSGYLGGQMIHAEHFSFKWGIRDYRNWLVAQMDKLGVLVCMETEPSPQELAQAGFDAVLAATGAEPQLPGSIRGLRDAEGRPLYPTCHDVFGREAELGKHVAIVGGSEVGVETAMYLAEHGHDVTVLTRQEELAADASHIHYITMAYMTVESDGTTRFASAWEKYENLRGIVDATTMEVRDNAVTYLDRQGQEHVLAADSVVICGGTAPRAAEALRYAECAPEFYAIGDCNGAGNLWKCGHDAFSKASML